MLDAIAGLPSETPQNWDYQAVLETPSWSLARWPQTLALPKMHLRRDGYIECYRLSQIIV